MGNKVQLPKFSQTTLKGGKIASLAPRKFYANPSQPYEEFVNKYCSLQEYLVKAKDYSDLKKQCDQLWKERYKNNPPLLEAFLKRENPEASEVPNYFAQSDGILEILSQKIENHNKRKIHFCTSSCST